jgi:hypothetical protein
MQRRFPKDLGLSATHLKMAAPAPPEAERKVLQSIRTRGPENATPLDALAE